MLDKIIKNIVEKEGRISVVELSVDSISVNPYQPRRNFDQDKLKGLAQSIKELGVIQPIIVRRLGSGYELVTGERRLRASKMAGCKTIPSIIRVINDQDMIEITFIENLQREQLDDIEKAEAYSQLIREKNDNIENIAERVGKDVTTIKKKLWMLQLPHVVRKAMSLNIIDTSHARLISKLSSQSAQVEILERICREKLTPAQLKSILSDSGVSVDDDENPTDFKIHDIVSGKFPEGSVELMEMFFELIRDFISAMRSTGANIEINENFLDSGLSVSIDFHFNDSKKHGKGSK